MDMMILKKKIVCLWLTSLLLTGIGLAQPDQAFPGKDQEEPMAAGWSMAQRHAPPEGVPIEVIYSGRGFALQDNQSHVLRLNIESILPLEPMQVQDLLASNKSLEEIRDEIRAREGEAVYRGGMKLEKIIYPLVNIVVSASDDNSTDLTADVSTEPGNKTAIIGRLKVHIAPTDDGLVGKGELTLGSGIQAGKYRILLGTQPSMHRMVMIRSRR